MSPAGRRLTCALALSLAAHALAVVGPGWSLVLDEEVVPAGRIDATLTRARKQVRTVQPAPAAPEPVSENTEVTSVAAVETPPPVEIAKAPEIESADKAKDRSKAANRNDTFPRSARLGFVVTRNGGLLVGHTRQSWQANGSGYRIENLTTAAGVVALFKTVKMLQVSEGTIDDTGLKPRAYRNERDDKITEEALFDWDADHLTLINSGNRREESLTPGAQDVLSLFYQTALIFHGDETITLNVATGKSFNTYRLAYLGEEVLSTRLGLIRAAHLKRVVEAQQDGIEIWLGRDVSGLPVRLRFTDRKGDVFDQMIDDIEIEGLRPVLPAADNGAADPVPAPG